MTFFSAVVLFGVLPIPVRLAAQNASSPIISFHAATAGEGTFPESINKAGAITGHYTDRKGLYHGFLRSPVGEFITFDAPGAGKSAGSGWGTFPESISDAGAITGHYIDSKDVDHGFLRSPVGELITFDAPGAGKSAGSGQGTFPHSISNAGAITGHYTDGHGMYRGFLRTPAGEFISFDAPGVDLNAGSGWGTVAESISNAGAITGHYIDSHDVNHGFVRGPSGGFTMFDAPGAGTLAGSGWGTLPGSISDAGAVTGHYSDSHNVNHGFVRGPSGEFTAFDAPGASSAAGSGDGTFPESINDAGAITGHYTDRHNLYRGFLRSPGGELITFDAPGAGTTAGVGCGTFPASISEAGAITGHYTEGHSLYHGFVRGPTGEFTRFDAAGAGMRTESGCGAFAR
ncbi:MAG: hypothetical protein WCB10_16315 [Steroidobacteraceae bacterium]